MPGSNLVFLPGGVSVPSNIVQPMAGNSALLTTNPTQVQMFLSMNFDYPFEVTSGDASVLRIQASYGTATQIYTQAVTSAQPVGNADDATWKRIAAEITGAQRSFGPLAAQALICEPDDWALPSAPYWTSFDSTESQSSSTTTNVPIPVVNRKLWMLRSLTVPPPATTEQPPAAPSGPRRGIAWRNYSSRPIALDQRISSAAGASAARSEQQPSAGLSSPTAMYLKDWQSAAGQGRLVKQVDAQLLWSATPGITNVTASSSSSVVAHLEHQCVTIGRYIAGQPWWDGVFLCDTGWFIPGMHRGGLLPTPDAVEGDFTYGLPIAMIVVRNFRVSGQWSQEAANALAAPGGTIGPLSLFGAAAKVESDGSVTYAHDGMQVVALLCSPLPVLPPMDTPTPGTPSSSSTNAASSPASGSTSSPSGDTSSSQPAGPTSTSPNDTSSAPASSSPGNASSSPSNDMPASTPVAPSSPAPPDAGATSDKPQP